jgi:hypothetical protein
VSGDQFPAQARGCAAQIGGSVRKPPTVGPAGVCMTYGGDGAGVGSAWAVPADATSAATAAAARTMFLTVFIDSSLVWNPVGKRPRHVRQRIPAAARCPHRAHNLPTVTVIPVNYRAVFFAAQAQLGR